MSNKLFKLLATTFVGLVVIWILQQLLHQGGGFNMSSYMNNSGMVYGHGSYMNGNLGTFSSLLSMLISILSIVFVIALLLAVVALIKNILFTTEDVQLIKNTFVGKSKLKCSICANELNENWKACPYCGKEIEESQK